MKSAVTRLVALLVASAAAAPLTLLAAILVLYGEVPAFTDLAAFLVGGGALALVLGTFFYLPATALLERRRSRRLGVRVAATGGALNFPVFLGLFLAARSQDVLRPGEPILFAAAFVAAGCVFALGWPWARRRQVARPGVAHHRA